MISKSIVITVVVVVALALTHQLLLLLLFSVLVDYQTKDYSKERVGLKRLPITQSISINLRNRPPMPNVVAVNSHRAFHVGLLITMKRVYM